MFTSQELWYKPIRPWCSSPRPAGFHRMAEESSATATKADPMAAARAEPPVLSRGSNRLDAELETCAWRTPVSKSIRDKKILLIHWVPRLD